jgi:hypothetical protein
MPSPFTEDAVFDERLISDDMYLIDHFSNYQTVSSQRNCESLFPLGFQKDQTYLPRAFEKVKEHPAYNYWKDLLHEGKTNEILLEVFQLDKGTCYGQVMFIVDCIKEKPDISSKELIDRIKWEEVFYSQMIHGIYSDLVKARGFLGSIYLDQVSAAKGDYEDRAVKAAKNRRDGCDETLSRMQREIKAPSIESITFLAKETPVGQYGLELGKISGETSALGTIYIRPYNPNSSDAHHVIFFQAYAGIFRMYDPNYGMFEYPDFKTLTVGLKLFVNRTRIKPQVVNFSLY